MTESPRSNAVEMPQKRVMLVVDDVPEWREQIRAVLLELFSGAEVLFAGNSDEAIHTIGGRGILGPPDIDLITLDLHTSPEGDRNGDVVLEHLMQNRLAVRVVIVSGTLTDDAKKKLTETLPNVPLLSKDGFAAYAKGTSERRVVEERLRIILSSTPQVIPNSPEYLAQLREAKSMLSTVSHLQVFADVIKGKVAGIYERYGAFLDALTDGNILKHPDLYDGVGAQLGHKIHTFKNTLPLLIDMVKRRGDVPAGLLEDLYALKRYVAATYVELMKKREKVDLGQCVGELCKLFNAASEHPQVTLEAPEEGRVEVVIADPVAHQAVLHEAVTNAVRHRSRGVVQVRVTPDGVVQILNHAGKKLPFWIQSNVVKAGSIPEVSTVVGGSAQGLKQMLQAADRLGLRIEVFGASDGEVDTKIKHPGARYRSKEGAAEQEKREVGGVLFYDHYAQPNETFAGFSVQDDFRALPFDEDEDTEYDLSREEARTDRQAVFDACFSQAQVFVAHMGGRREKIIASLKNRHPHLVIIPVTSQPEDILGELDEHEADGTYSHVITSEDLQQHCDHSDTNLLGAMRRELYDAEHSPQVWNAIIRTVRRMVAAQPEKYVRSSE